MRRVLVGIGTASLMILMVGCEERKDALVVNPCNTEVVARLTGGATLPPNEEWDALLTLPPLSARVVKHAFTDLEGGRYIVQVTTGGEDNLLHIDRTNQRPEPVIIPAELCPSA